ncbi:MAG: hypothetical protein ABEK50_10360 [bacterium]
MRPMSEMMITLGGTVMTVAYFLRTQGYLRTPGETSYRDDRALEVGSDETENRQNDTPDRKEPLPPYI